MAKLCYVEGEYKDALGKLHRAFLNPSTFSLSDFVPKTQTVISICLYSNNRQTFSCFFIYIYSSTSTCSFLSQLGREMSVFFS